MNAFLRQTDRTHPFLGKIFHSTGAPLNLRKTKTFELDTLKAFKIKVLLKAAGVINIFLKLSQY